MPIPAILAIQQFAQAMAVGPFALAQIKIAALGISQQRVDFLLGRAAVDIE